MKFTKLPQKVIFVILLLIGCAIILNYFKVFDNHPTLYCEAKNRGLTNEEFIIAPLEGRYKYNAIKIDDSTKTPQDFYEKYPYCCRSRQASFAKRSSFTGKVYNEYEDYVNVTLYFPTSEKVMNMPIKVVGEKQPKYIDKDLAYTKLVITAGRCGQLGSGPTEYLNIKNTPFGNELIKSSNLLIKQGN